MSYPASILVYSLLVGTSYLQLLAAYPSPLTLKTNGMFQVRMQLAGVSKLTSCDAHTVLTAGRKLWQHEGVQGLYRGKGTTFLHLSFVLPDLLG